MTPAKLPCPSAPPLLPLVSRHMVASAPPPVHLQQYPYHQHSQDWGIRHLQSQAQTAGAGLGALLLPDVGRDVLPSGRRPVEALT